MDNLKKVINIKLIDKFSVTIFFSDNTSKNIYCKSEDFITYLEQYANSINKPIFELLNDLLNDLKNQKEEVVELKVETSTPKKEENIEQKVETIIQKKEEITKNYKNKSKKNTKKFIAFATILALGTGYALVKLPKKGYVYNNDNSTTYEDSFNDNENDSNIEYDNNEYNNNSEYNNESNINNESNSNEYYNNEDDNNGYKYLPYSCNEVFDSHSYNLAVLNLDVEDYIKSVEGMEENIMGSISCFFEGYTVSHPKRYDSFALQFNEFYDRELIAYLVDIQEYTLGILNNRNNKADVEKHMKFIYDFIGEFLINKDYITINSLEGYPIRFSFRELTPLAQYVTSIIATRALWVPYDNELEYDLNYSKEDYLLIIENMMEKAYDHLEKKGFIL